MNNHNILPTTCDMCGDIYQRAQPFDNSVPLWGASLSMSGGYAEFWDYGGEPDISLFQLHLCHDCTLPIFRKIMGSVKYTHLKMDFFARSHQNESDSGETPCCEYSYDPRTYEVSKS